MPVAEVAVLDPSLSVDDLEAVRSSDEIVADVRHTVAQIRALQAHLLGLHDAFQSVIADELRKCGFTVKIIGEGTDALSSERTGPKRLKVYFLSGEESPANVIQRILQDMHIPASISLILSSSDRDGFYCTLTVSIHTNR